MFFSQVYEVFPVLFLWVGVIDDDTLAIFDGLFGYFVALLFCFKGVSVDSFILWHVVVPKCWFSSARAACEYNHLFLYEFDILIGRICEQASRNGDCGWVESFYFYFSCVSMEQVFRSFELYADIKGKFSKLIKCYRSESEKSLCFPSFLPAASPQKKDFSLSALPSLLATKVSHILRFGFLYSSSMVAMTACISTPISFAMSSIFFLISAALAFPVEIPFWFVKMTIL